MILEWTQHLKDPDERARFENQIRAAGPVLERLSQMLASRADHVEKSELTQADFDNPSWAYKQAFRNGFKSALTIASKYTDIRRNDDQSIRQTTPAG